MDHQKGSDRNQIFFTTLEEMVPQDSFARIIDLVVNSLPLKALGFMNIQLNQEGNQPYYPGDLLKLILYGQRHGIRSANKLVYSALINTEIMWLIGNLKPSLPKKQYNLKIEKE